MRMLRLAVIATLLAACDVGEIPGATGDGGGSGSGSGSADGGGSGSNCENISATPPDGHHNDGMTCVSSGCHLEGMTGAGAPAYSLGGTLYKDSAGTMPYAGATVLVTINGATKKAITATNGNFWFVPALVPSPTNAMTGSTSASGCPNTLSMSGLLVQGGGDCNNCHRTGGTTSPIHLP